MLRLPRNKLSRLQIRPFREEEQTLAEGRVNGGIVTTIDAADIANNQFVDLKNVFVRFDKTTRRYGSIPFVPASPDAVKVLSVTPWERFSGVVNIIRLTQSSVYLGGSAAWTVVAGALTGGPNDRFNTVIANDRAFFANNGADYIQEINPGAFTFARAGNAPKYKYLAAFNNRLIGANLAPNVPIQIGWSADYVFDEWNPAVNLSAGSVSLIDSPSDYSDSIQGIFGFTDVALILRTRSIWAMSKQPIATQPFNFYIIAPGIGCDSPYTAVAIKNGIAWFDYRSGNAYRYSIGMTEPEMISMEVGKAILAQVNNVSTLFASYNTVEDEYTICIPSDTSTLVKAWTYNFRTKAWWYEEYTNLSALSNIDYKSTTILIDDLLGTIASLTGTISNLGSNNPVASRIYSFTNGAMLAQAKTKDTDNNAAYTTVITSKIYYVPRHDGYIANLRIEYMPMLVGSFTVAYSRDGGLTWTDYKTVTWMNSDANKRKLVNFKKHLKCSQYSWRITSTSGLFDILEYEVWAVGGAESRSR